MKVSVVMTTYNGEKYIYEQLLSLYNQSRKIDELIIMDDCSTDRTTLIIRDFIKKYQLSNWTLIINEKNYGWKCNFIRGFQKVSGDIIFPCDQDDIWYHDKIEKMTEILEKDKKILVLASNYTPYYLKGAIKISRKITRQFHNTGRLIQYSFRENFIHVDRPGCVSCFRKDFFENISKLWLPTYSHDGLLWWFSIIQDGLYIYDKATILYRRHSQNITNGKGNFIREYNHYINVMNQLKNEIENNKKISDIDAKKRILNRGFKWCEINLKILEKRNPFLWIKVLPYIKYYRSVKSSFKIPVYIILDRLKEIKNESSIYWSRNIAKWSKQMPHRNGE